MKENPTVIEITKKFLIEKGYGGLCNPENECGCMLEDLFCCSSDGIQDCQAGYKTIVTKKNTENYPDIPIGDFIISLEM